MLRDSIGFWHRLIPPGVRLSWPIRTVTADSAVLFFDMPDGIGVRNLSAGGWTFWDRKVDIPSGPVTALHAESGLLWVATPGMILVVKYVDAMR